MRATAKTLSWLYLFSVRASRQDKASQMSLRWQACCLSKSNGCQTWQWLNSVRSELNEWLWQLYWGTFGSIGRMSGPFFTGLCLSYTFLKFIIQTLNLKYIFYFQFLMFTFMSFREYHFSLFQPLPFFSTGHLMPPFPFPYCGHMSTTWTAHCYGNPFSLPWYNGSAPCNTPFWWNNIHTHACSGKRVRRQGVCLFLCVVHVQLSLWGHIVLVGTFSSPHEGGGFILRLKIYFIVRIRIRGIHF